MFEFVLFISLVHLLVSYLEVFTVFYKPACLIEWEEYTLSQGKLLSIPGLFPCIAGGGVVGGVIDRCMIRLLFKLHNNTVCFNPVCSSALVILLSCLYVNIVNHQFVCDNSHILYLWLLSQTNWWFTIFTYRYESNIIKAELQTGMFMHKQVGWPFMTYWHLLYVQTLMFLSLKQHYWFTVMKKKQHENFIA